MKRTALLIIALAIGSAVKAQTFGEWFRQKSTQRKYLLEQIAALKVYGSYVKKGYKLAQQGLNTIGQIKDGDINLHRLHFNSLRNVNPLVRNYKRTNDIIAIQDDIRTETANSRNVIAKAATLRKDEKDYLASVYDRLQKDCMATLDELEAVITDGKLEMKDDERIMRINELFRKSQSQYQFTKTFSSEIAIHIIQKASEIKDIDQQKHLYQIN